MAGPLKLPLKSGTMSTETIRTFLLSCAPGLEPLLSEELKQILGEKVSDLSPGHGVVGFSCEPVALADVMAYSRLGSRLLMPVKSFASANLEMLYDQVRRINWPELFPNTDTFAISSHGLLGVPGIAASILPLKIKDAICDEFRKKGFDRPDVDRVEPKVRIEAHFTLRRCELSIELTAYPLHRRLYRLEGGNAPLREDKAAALVAFAGLEAQRPVVDAFTGSGTLAIEAALKLTGAVNPSLKTMNLRDLLLTRYYPEVVGPLKERMHAKPVLPTVLDIRGIDLDARALSFAQENARRAGVAKWIRFEKADARTLRGEKLQILGNPPYGERLGDQQASAELISNFTRHLKHHLAPCDLSLILPKGELEKSTGLKPSRKIDFENASLPSRFLKFTLFSGSKEKSF